jgi:hypothetical protein
MKYVRGRVLGKKTQGLALSLVAFFLREIFSSQLNGFPFER